jgi:hypothetical protein
MSTLQKFIPLTKVDAEKRIVYGVATAEKPDRDGEICDYASTRPYFEAWSSEISKSTGGKSLGNVRAMHGKVAAGKLTDITFNDGEKQIEVCAKVVDDDEWRKVQEGVYTGFSQGGKYVKRWPDPDNAALTRYTAEPIEISLVDLPALPEATFEIVKAGGVVERHPFKAADPADDDVSKGIDKAADGVEYADPGYQDDGKKRYPLDTEKHIRAAWSYIHTEDNQKPYTAEQVDKIKAKIVSAWKAKVDKDGPPAASEKAAATQTAGKGDNAKPKRDPDSTEGEDEDEVDPKKVIEPTEALLALSAKTYEPSQFWACGCKGHEHVRKADAIKCMREQDMAKAANPLSAALDALEAKLGIEKTAAPDERQVAKAALRNALAKFIGEEAWDAGTALQALNWIFDLLRKEMAETENAPEQEDALRAAADKLKAFIVSELQENNDPDALEAAAGAMDLLKAEVEKRGARNSKSDMARIQGIHDHTAALGAKCALENCGKSAEGDDLAKALEAENEALKKQIGDAAARFSGITEALEKRIANLEAQPAPAKAVIAVVKGAGVAAGGGDAPDDVAKQAQAYLASLSADQRAMFLMKVSLANPVPVIPKA